MLELRQCRQYQVDTGPKLNVLDGIISSLLLTLNVFQKEKNIDSLWKYLTVVTWVSFEDAKSIWFFNVKEEAWVRRKVVIIVGDF